MVPGSETMNQRMNLMISRSLVVIFTITDCLHLLSWLRLVAVDVAGCTQFVTVTATTTSGALLQPVNINVATNHHDQRRVNPSTSDDDLSQRRRGNGRRMDSSLDFLLVGNKRTNVDRNTNIKREISNVADELHPQQSSNSNFWPPWPFSMLQQQHQTDLTDFDDDENRQNSGELRHRKYLPHMVLNKLGRFTRTSTKVGFRTVQEFGSQLWFHSPPAIPPIIVYALWPYRTRITISSTTTTATTTAAIDAVVASENSILYKTILPIWSNGFVRNGVLFTLALAIASWAHAEINRNRKLTPLPLLYHDLLRAELPPFLPAQVSTIAARPVVDGHATTGSSLFHTNRNNNIAQEDGEMGSSAIVTTPRRSDVSGSVQNDNDDTTSTDVEGLLANLSPRRWRRHLLQFRTITPRPLSIRNKLNDWQQMRQIYHAEQKNAHRLAIYEELLLWQKATTATTAQKGPLKSRQPMKSKSIIINRKNILSKWNPFRKLKQLVYGPTVTSDNDDDSDDTTTGLGCALVTGASQGIGRAIAVELARWHIPLILVARDVQVLSELAYDLQVCYGIDCTVLSADLSRPHASEQIYQTVSDAGLKVDILVSNAGISSHGETLNIPLVDVQRMIQVNTMAVTSLTHLFGREMKERRRGRILLVSSICGAVSGIASVAVYAATKAYENSLGSGLGKELEPYGIGVTCLMPGAVRNTEFRSRSNSHDALCWKIPFYTKSPPSVAECGVRALLRGDTEVTPGVLNRLFLKVLKPILPQRMHNLLAEIMWNPIQLPFRSQINGKRSVQAFESIVVPESEFNSSTPLASMEQPRPIIVRPEMSFHSTTQTAPPPRILILKEPIQEEQQNQSTVIVIDSLENALERSAAIRTLDDTDEKEIQNHSDTKNEKTNIISEEQSTVVEKKKNSANDAQQQRLPVAEVDPNEENYQSAVPSPQQQQSELDLILDQYKKHRSISIDDPWSTSSSSNGYNTGRFIDSSHMLLPKSINENKRFFDTQEL